MLNQPNKLFLIVGILLIAISFVPFKKTLDIHVHDTFYVIGLNQVYWAFAILLFIFSLLYWWTYKLVFSTILTWTHISFTLFSVVFIVTAPYWISSIEESFSNDPLSAMEQRYRFRQFLYFSTLLLLIGQLTYFINLIGGILKRYL